MAMASRLTRNMIDRLTIHAQHIWVVFIGLDGIYYWREGRGKEKTNWEKTHVTHLLSKLLPGSKEGFIIWVFTKRSLGNIMEKLFYYSFQKIQISHSNGYFLCRLSIKAENILLQHKSSPKCLCPARSCGPGILFWWYNLFQWWSLEFLREWLINMSIRLPPSNDAS